MKVEESTVYDNCLDIAERKVPGKAATLFEVEDATTRLVKETEKQSTKSKLKVLKVHFETHNDYADFMSVLKLKAVDGLNKITYPQSQLFTQFDQSYRDYTEEEQQAVQESETKLFEQDTEKNPNHWKKHWLEMPDFEQEEKKPYKTVHVFFRTDKDVEDFKEAIDQDFTTAKSIWHPKLEITQNKLLRWIECND